MTSNTYIGSETVIIERSIAIENGSTLKTWRGSSNQLNWEKRKESSIGPLQNHYGHSGRRTAQKSEDWRRDGRQRI